ncbi:MAG: 7-cyano-7-deazaguanine synthase QueC, partial [Gammaproteobacteria bacterium]|nr:7-cyano-7-deazaguanine synthase QueC [Gammaproteobacteria bacterium]
MSEKAVKKAVVLLSGGLDSTTVLALARSQGFECYALTVNYGQTHVSELQAAKRIAEKFAVARHQILKVDMSCFGGSALTDPSIAVPTEPSQGIPVTYVPARNTIMLSLAMAWAEVLGSEDIFIGVNAVDYSGYPDCRPDFIQAFTQMAALATKAGREGRGPTIHTPLIEKSKAEIIRLGMELGVDYVDTVTCYQADE